MELKLLGPGPFEKNADGSQKNKIGTLFLDDGVLFTQPPGVHFLQREGFIDHQNAERAVQGRPPLTLEEEQQLRRRSVDLVFNRTHILIRPVWDALEQVFEADNLLQTKYSKRLIMFLNGGDGRMRAALRQRGDYWRLYSIPRGREAKQKLVAAAKVAIGGQPIYFYNQITGTRWLTCAQFGALEKMDEAALAAHLQEIADFSIRHNRDGRRELDFFAADMVHFGPQRFAGVAFNELASDVLRENYRELKKWFALAVHEAFRQDKDKSGDDKPGNDVWLNRMVETLFLDGHEAQAEQVMAGISPDYSMNLEWRPGGRNEDGEFLFDPIYDEAALHPNNPDLQYLCDPLAKGIIFNFIREYTNIEYINLARIPDSQSIARLPMGRRGVYLAEFLCRGESAPFKRLIRLQKWGVREHLDDPEEKYTLRRAIAESDQYTEYCLDRLLGCRQLGMNLLSRVVMRSLPEKYTGKNEDGRNWVMRTVYFEREFFPGDATDRVALVKYSNPEYARRFAALLGKAAAPSMIVGRWMVLPLQPGVTYKPDACLILNPDGKTFKRPVFDDGDEVVNEGADGLPVDIVQGDHTGAFYDYREPLAETAAYYARPINIRDGYVANKVEFAEAYLAAFYEQFIRVQEDYRLRRCGFDALFDHYQDKDDGNCRHRWKCVLERLKNTDVNQLVAAIRQHIRVLNA